MKSLTELIGSLNKNQQEFLLYRILEVPTGQALGYLNLASNAVCRWRTRGTFERVETAVLAHKKDYVLEAQGLFQTRLMAKTLVGLNYVIKGELTALNSGQGDKGLLLRAVALAQKAKVVPLKPNDGSYEAQLKAVNDG